jgi:UDP-N-acetylglucosamine transferase subunit ALG13
LIFVTVGSSLPFDDLVMAIDSHVEQGLITDPVVCQIGHGAYIPRHCEYFRFAPGLDEWIKKATVVVGHGGTGTVSGMLAERKPFVAVPNPNVQDDHQAQFLERLSQLVPILWTRDLAQLPRLIAQAPDFRLEVRKGERLCGDLRSYLASSTPPVRR